ncbi:MAG: hypothetical protein HRT68_06635 [Flavobacteriaceae bacterium]|nr:hypothetical protein [Flavobacteriaceae bacterium]
MKLPLLLLFFPIVLLFQMQNIVEEKDSLVLNYDTGAYQLYEQQFDQVKEKLSLSKKRYKKIRRLW